MPNEQTPLLGPEPPKRQVRPTKRDPLLNLGHGRIAASAFVDELKSEGGKHHVTTRTTILTASSCLAFALALIMVARFYHSAPIGSLIANLQLAFVGVALAVFWKKERWHAWLGRFIVTAVCWGTCVGLYIYYTDLAYYRHYQKLGVETNVAPSQGTALLTNAGMLGFTSDTYLDTSRAVGYESVETGRILCVAPILDQTMTSSTPITLYAAGTDCCTWRGHFGCGDAGDPQAHGAVMYLSAEEVVNPAMRWAVQEEQVLLEGFLKAAKLQASVFESVVSEDPLEAPRFAMWARHPRTVVDSYFRSAMLKVATAFLTFFGVCLVASICAAVGYRQFWLLLAAHLDSHDHIANHAQASINRRSAEV